MTDTEPSRSALPNSSVGFSAAEHMAAMSVRRAADLLVAMPIQDAVVILAAMDAATSARRLRAMHPEEAAAILADMDESLALQRLQSWEVPAVADLFRYMPAQRVAELVT
jgi:Mg/Co/Ni transporter MgtE